MGLLDVASAGDVIAVVLKVPVLGVTFVFIDFGVFMFLYDFVCSGF
jgi:hypothetical protein